MPCRHRPLRLLAAAALAAAALPALAEIVPIRFDADRRFVQRLQVPPGKFVEACGSLPVGSAVRWRFGADAPLDFNIHYHEGKSALFPVKLDASAGADGTLDGAVAQPYCWMWTNRASKAATVDLQLSH